MKIKNLCLIVLIIGISFSLFATSASDKNIAVGKPVYASSVYSVNYPITHINDGNSTSVWGTAASNKTEWFYIDLEVVTKISGVQIAWVKNFNPTHYTIYTSVDAVNWKAVYTDNNCTGEIKDLMYQTECRYLGVTLRKPGSTAAIYGIGELRVYQRTASPFNGNNLKVVEDLSDDVYKNVSNGLIDDTRLYYVRNADTDPEIIIADITNPHVPQKITSMKTGDNHLLAVYGTYLIAARNVEGDHWFNVYDMTDVINPVSVFTKKWDRTYFEQAKVYKNYLLVQYSWYNPYASGGVFAVFDLSTITDIKEITAVRSHSRDFVINDQYLFYTKQHLSPATKTYLHVVPLKNLPTLDSVATFEYGPASQMFIQDTMLCFIYFNSIDADVFDITDPLNIQSKNQVEITATDVVIDYMNYLFTTNDALLKVYDITDVTAPVNSTNHTLTAPITTMMLSNRVLYVFTDLGLTIFAE